VSRYIFGASDGHTETGWNLDADTDVEAIEEAKPRLACRDRQYEGAGRQHPVGSTARGGGQGPLTNRH